MANTISFDQAKLAITYDPISGILTWNNDSYGGFNRSVLIHNAGDEAGCLRADGRRVIRINNQLVLSYRLAWLLQTGVWPLKEIDHINGNPNDNRWENLRDVCRAKNQENIRRAISKKTTSKYLGVHLDKRKSKKKWRACIQANGKQIQIGLFFTEEEAYAAYLGAKRILHKGCTI